MMVCTVVRTVVHTMVCTVRCKNFVSCGVKGDRQFDWLIACETEYKRALHGTYDGMDI